MVLDKFVVENIGFDDGISYRLSRLKLVKVEASVCVCVAMSAMCVT